ncbi:hypothetical protein [Aliamphritea spongicola]|nr:hypothetical protein [Aliamphritea spongicola]
MGSDQRYPLKDDNDKIIGAFGFVATDSINPLINKYNKLQDELQAAKDKLNSDRPATGCPVLSVTAR